MTNSECIDYFKKYLKEEKVKKIEMDGNDTLFFIQRNTNKISTIY